MHSVLPVTDLPALALVGITLVVTSALFFVALRISADFRSVENKVHDLRREIDERAKGRTQEMTLLAVIRDIVRQSTQLEHKYAIVLTKCLLLVQESSGVADPDTMKFLESEMATFVLKSDRFEKYLRLVPPSPDASSDIDFELLLSNTISTYPDEQTIAFLDVLGNSFSNSRQKILQRYVRQLTIEVRGIESYLWTGIK
jgi:hypothetical protein